MRKKIEIVLIMAVLFGVLMIGRSAGEKLLGEIEERKIVPTAGNTEKRMVVLDSGHGGYDPGKIGINNVVEKDINLQISKKIQTMLEEKNVEVIMTREEDRSLGESKKEDLNVRVDLINQTKPSIAVSIHQNSYPDKKIRGAQVFYYTHSKEGEAAAKILQETLRETEPENHRQAKANDTYYMLKKTEIPVVIVECGFLSNPEEAQNLCEEEYQARIAGAIIEGILEYIK